MLREYTKLVRDFDRLCDDIRLVVNEYSKLNFEDEKNKLIGMRSDRVFCK